MRPNEGRGRRGEPPVLSTVGSWNRLVARKMRGGTEEAVGASNSGEWETPVPRCFFDNVNVHNRGPEGK